VRWGVFGYAKALYEYGLIGLILNMVRPNYQRRKGDSNSKPHNKQPCQQPPPFTNRAYLWLIALRLPRAARIVRSISQSVCAAETNSASNCDGAMNTPRSSISRKNFA
jgi:hypothetical protein